MKNLRIILALIFTLSLSSKIFSQDAESVINSYIKAMGGSDKILAVKTLRYTGKISSGGMEINFVQTLKRPLMFMAEITMQGLTMKQAYDGTKGWFINPFSGKKEPDLLPKEQEKAFKKQADFEGELINYKAKGSTVELVGKEDYEGSQVYNIKLTNKDGDISNFYIDADSYLLLKQKEKMKFDTKEVVSETIFSDYKPVEGYLFPFAMEVKIPDNPMGSQKLILEKIEANIPVDDSYFKMPDTKQ